MTQAKNNFVAQPTNSSPLTSKINRKNPTVALLIDIAIVFFLVALIAVCLRLISDTFFNKNLIPIAQASQHQSEFVEQSHSYVNIRPNTGFTFILKFKNVGNSTWTKDSVYLKSLTTALKFRHHFWPDPFLPARLMESQVAPGEIGTFKYALNSPAGYGLFTGEFVLVNDNVLIAGGETTVTMNNVDDPENHSTPIVQKDPEPSEPTKTEPTTPIATTEYCTLNFRIANLIDGSDGIDNSACVRDFNLPQQGPMMRVGLFHTTEIITVKNTKPWHVDDSDGTVLGNFSADTEFSFFYDPQTKQYSFDLADKTVRTSKYITLRNSDDGMFTITSYNNIPSFNQNINYNDFIGDLEIRYNDSKKRTWVIEIIPMETYLKGVQETTNYDPIEYLKTMSIAARTYAAYHYDRYTKHAKEFFHVDSRFDQVYKGYVSMLIFPRVGEAVDATTGVVATYNDKVIVAPYFSRSDGRTRSYQEVWVWDIPYLVSVPAPYSEGKTLFGHGVGIDAYDALRKSRNDDWTYDQLLKYYYTGVQLEKIW